MIHAARAAIPEILQEGRPCVLAGAEEDRVRVRHRLVRQRCDVKTAKRHVGAFAPVVVGQTIRPVRGGDVHLNHNEVGRVIQMERLYVLVLNLHLIVRS